MNIPNSSSKLHQHCFFRNSNQLVPKGSILGCICSLWNSSNAQRGYFRLFNLFRWLSPRRLVIRLLTCLDFILKLFLLSVEKEWKRFQWTPELLCNRTNKVCLVNGTLVTSKSNSTPPQCTQHRSTLFVRLWLYWQVGHLVTIDGFCQVFSSQWTPLLLLPKKNAKQLVLYGFHQPKWTNSRTQSTARQANCYTPLKGNTTTQCVILHNNVSAKL